MLREHEGLDHVSSQFLQQLLGHFTQKHKRVTDESGKQQLRHLTTMERFTPDAHWTQTQPGLID